MNNEQLTTSVYALIGSTIAMLFILIYLNRQYQNLKQTVIEELERLIDSFDDLPKGPPMSLFNFIFDSFKKPAHTGPSDSRPDWMQTPVNEAHLALLPNLDTAALNMLLKRAELNQQFEYAAQINSELKKRFE